MAGVVGCGALALRLSWACMVYGTLVLCSVNWKTVELLSFVACWKARAKAEIEAKRSSGFFARACKMTVSTFAGKEGTCVLGGCGSLVRCWYIICPGPP